MTTVLDADVVIGALDARDPHHARARARFVAWHRSSEPRVMSAVNLTEVLVGQAADPARLRTAREAVALLGIRVHAASEVVAVDAARLRARHPVSIADAYALATVRHLGGRLCSFDRRLVRAAADEGLAVVA